VPTSDSGSPAADACVIVARVRRAHGIRGELVVESITDDPESVFLEGRQLLPGTVTGARVPDAAPLTVRRATPFKQGWILSVDEIVDRTVADTWRDRYLFLPSAELAAPTGDEVYYHDLVGMRVEGNDGAAIGTVEGWYDLPHGLMLDVRTAAGSVMLPYRPEVIARVDVARGTIVVDPPPGFFD
jgi:16S rRNA processing protein RimM